MQELRAERDSLIANLEAARLAASEPSAPEDPAGQQVTAVGSQEDGGKQASGESSDAYQKTGAQFAAQLEAVQTEKESLTAQLETAHLEVEQLRAVQVEADRHFSQLQGELAAAQSELSRTMESNSTLKTDIERLGTEKDN